MARSAQPRLTLRGSRVTFTGYLSQVRAVAAAEVVRKGGIVDIGVSRATDILVQGSPNAAYKYTAIGLKLDYVQRQRRQGYDIAIISEEELDVLLSGGRLSRAEERAARGAGRIGVTDPFGVAYRVRPEKRTSAARRDVWRYDPDDLDRKTHAHMAMQNAVARAAEQRELKPLSPVGADCQFDIAWRSGRTLTVVEVKTFSATNEAKQLRLAIGQVLDYRNVLVARSGAATVQGVICVPRAPSGQRYVALCGSVGVNLTWPPNYRGMW